ncbi:MAG: hypothetical protein HYT81_02225 [Gemmatimonadetes bacterium]|nr:hypothetical protein [Gemmatimonadota bacterium]MBI2402635.1 hypothetical protein [Gemmatimonadota bacterium]
MGILLFLIGVLCAASGAVKLKARTRQLGRPGLAVGEVVAGALVVLGSGVGLARLRPLAWTAVAGAATMIVLSSIAHLGRVLEDHRRRRESEERRLQQYLEPPAR